MSIVVKNAGPLTMIQDAGRFGYQASGIRPAGVMDTAAFKAGNWLVGNCSNEAVLEMTFLGAALEFTEDAIIALTGADMQAKIAGKIVERYQTVKVLAGQVLTIGMAVNGCRAYLAVHGGIASKSVLQSRSTDRSAKLGGLDGKGSIIKKGDIIPLNNPAAWQEDYRFKSVPVYAENVIVRVIMGPQADFFTSQGIATFLTNEYEIAMDSDRMGITLDGPVIASNNGYDIVSDGIVFGSVQVTAAGKPIVLMADHQTTGGYAKIGTVVAADLPKLAQLKPGDKVRFTKTTVEAVQAEYEYSKEAMEAGAMDKADYSRAKPAEVRKLIRAGKWTNQTSNMCDGFAQANLVILPKAIAYDFLLFAQRNPRPCPLLEVSDTGKRLLKIIAKGADIATDIPKYRLYKKGVLAGEFTNIADLWQDDFVSFLIGCSFSFEGSLLEAGVPVRHIEEHSNVPMFNTNIACKPAGIFHGNMVVSMRPIPYELVSKAVQITGHMPKVHGAPIHIGAPELIGIKDVTKPDYGDAVTIKPGEVPVFWPCGVTPQNVIMESKPDIVITHAPGHMLITDVKNINLEY